MKNIGNVFVKMGQYTDAITTYEHIMSDKPDVETGMTFFILQSRWLFVCLSI